MSRACENMFLNDSSLLENYKLAKYRKNSKIINKMTRYEESSPESNALSLFILSSSLQMTRRAYFGALESNTASGRS